MSRGPTEHPSLLAVLAILLLLSSGDELQAQHETRRLPAKPPALEELDALLDSADYSAAEHKARGLLNEVEAEFGADSLQVAWVLDRLLDALRRGTGMATDEAFELAHRAIEIKEARLGPRHPELRSSLNQLAILHYLKDELRFAVEHLKRVLDIFEGSAGLNDPGVATIFNNLGVILIQAGDLEEALAVLQRALKIRRQSLEPEHPHLAQSAFNLALVYRRLGNLTQALPLAEESVELNQKVYGTEDPRVAEGLHLLGVVLKDYGRYSEAQVHLESSLAIREKSLGKDHPSVSDSLIDLANLVSDLGDPAASKPLYERALAIREAALGADSDAVALALNNLGIAQADLGFHHQARQTFERALAIREGLFGPNHTGVATLLNNLADELWALGEMKAARQGFLRALEIRQEQLPAPHPLVAESLENVASFLAATGEAAQSMPLYERALKMYERTLGAKSFRVGGTLRALAEARLALNPTAEVLGPALRAEAIGRDHLRRTAAHLSESQALRFARVRAGGLDVALTLAATDKTDRLDRIWDALIRGRSLVFDELASRHRLVTASRDPAFRALAAETVALRRQRANLLVRGPEPEDVEGFGALLRELEEEAQANEQTLARMSSKSGAERPQVTPGYLEIRDALPEQSALVSIARYVHVEGPSSPQAPSRPQAYLALILRSDAAAPVLVRLGRAPRVELAVRRWREAIVHMAGTAGSAGRSLRELVWDAMAPHLDGVRRIFLVPDGMLHLVNLAALPLSDGRYLVEEPFTLHYLTTERDLLAPPLPGRRGKAMLVMGGPDYDAVLAAARAKPVVTRHRAGLRGGQAPCPEFRTLRFEPLPSTLKEVRSVAGLWARTEEGPVSLLTGAAATESALKEKAAGHRVLHLATHGFFLADQCRSSLGGRRGIGAVTSAGSQRPTGNDSFSAALSGLVLAGANHRLEASLEEDDGILTAAEIATLDLRSVEWAVLSGCETGLGEVRSGEGVFGLKRAFRMAGAQTVVISLWPVNDESSREWMELFYESRLERHLSTAEAVQQASQRLLESRRRRGLSAHPLYWGGFLAAGRQR